MGPGGRLMDDEKWGKMLIEVKGLGLEVGGV